MGPSPCQELLWGHHDIRSCCGAITMSGAAVGPPSRQELPWGRRLAQQVGEQGPVLGSSSVS